MIIEARNIMYSYKSKRDTLVLKQVMLSSDPADQGRQHFFPFWLGLTVRYRETSSLMERISKRRG